MILFPVLHNDKIFSFRWWVIYIPVKPEVVDGFFWEGTIFEDKVVIKQYAIFREFGFYFFFRKPISKWKKFDFSRFLVISERILPFSDRKSSRIFSWTQPKTRDFSQRTTMASFRNIYIDLGCRGFMSNLKNAIFDIFFINDEIILPFWTGNQRWYSSAYWQFRKPGPKEPPCQFIMNSKYIRAKHSV